MREILFRGQTRKNGEKVHMNGEKVPGNWVYGGVLQGIGSHSIIYGGQNENDPSEGFEKWAVHTDTLGQFTGLTDKNGKKIFEGDIIQHGKRKGTIFYYGNFGMFMISWIPNGGANIFMNVLHTEVEVIGNIHDNPELLEE